MTDEFERSEIESNLEVLRSDRDGLDQDIAAAEEQLAAAGDENESARTTDNDPPPTAAVPTDTTALIAEIQRLEGEKKYVEAAPLKSRLVGLASGYGGAAAQPSSTPAPVSEPTAAELSEAVTKAEAAGNQKTASALKAQWLRQQGHGQ